MIIVLSPAKSIDFETKPTTKKATQPEFLDDSQALVDILKDYSPDKLGSLMGISDKLANLNAARYGSWSTPFDADNAKQAILSFTGDVYQGLDANTLDTKGLNYAQKHVRIVSGLYGLLKPLDYMQPYRLEMGTKLATDKGNNLYEYWGTALNEKLQEAFKKDKHPVLINCASKEYFTALKLKDLPNRIITPTFKDWKNGQYKQINFYAKKARGLITRYAIDNKIENPEDLKNFDYDGYSFNAEGSTENDWLFTRKQA